MIKIYQFRELFQGTAKKDGKPFRVLKLHDPETLEPVEFFLNETLVLHTANIARKDFVEVTHELSQISGRAQLGVVAMIKQKVS